MALGAAFTLASAPTSASATTLKREDAEPGKLFYAGTRKAVFRYEIAASQPVDLVIAAVRRHHGPVREWHRKNVEPGTTHKIRWNGTTRTGKEVHKGRYFFRVKDRSGKVDRSRAHGTRSFGVYPDIFPVRGHHSYGDGFGAGRGHDGQDVFADCGTKLVAARAGRVAQVGNERSGYGHYLVINVKREPHAHLYAHLKRKPVVHEGERVRTGERLGRVGQSGNAQGCHLHFEYWRGSYPGGSARASVTKHLKAWDGWS